MEKSLVLHKLLYCKQLQEMMPLLKLHERWFWQLSPYNSFDTITSASIIYFITITIYKPLNIYTVFLFHLTNTFAPFPSISKVTNVFICNFPYGTKNGEIINRMLVPVSHC